MEPEKIDSINLNIPSDGYIGKYSSFPLIAGILLIFTGFLSIFGWILFMNIDESLLGDFLIQIQETVPSYTISDLKNFISSCSLIGIVVSIFPILGGILSIKKKMWGVVLISSIIGFVVIMPIFILIFIPFISTILLIVSRKEFQKSSN